MDHPHVADRGLPVPSTESPVSLSPAATPSLPRLIIIQGPTATGKSELAVRLAEKFDGEIVGADSLQLYRGMSIGTAAPGPELTSRIPHHLISILDPDASFTAADYAREAGEVIAGILSRGRTPFVVGGTGLYIRALLGGLIQAPAGDDDLRRELAAWAERDGSAALLGELERIDPETAARLHPNDRGRIIRALEVCRITGMSFSEMTRRHGFSEIRYAALKIGLTRERTELYQRVNERVERMLAAGFVGEVRGLLAQGYSPETKSLRSIGYKEICRYLAGELALTEAAELIKRDTRHYLKRQLTWFFRDVATKWFEYPENFASIQRTVEEFIVSPSSSGEAQH
jgi:tRNA dimethylallyltransferase